jgi:hypothetical protein
MTYLVEFVLFVDKDSFAVSLDVVVIHKHISITIRNEIPLFP